MRCRMSILFFFSTATATTEIYTLSLHDALPIWVAELPEGSGLAASRRASGRFWSHNDSGEPVLFALDTNGRVTGRLDRKSTRLNSSHGYISYAVFCLKKKKKKTQQIQMNARECH